MKVFILMLQFLTRIPIHAALNVDQDDFAKGVVYFPIIGLITGGAGALVFYLAYGIFGAFVAALLSVFTNIAITGALHYDGLADSCDGLFSSRGKDRMLEIMRDSRIGAMGVIAVVFDILLKFAALISIPPKAAILAAFLAPVAAKSVVIVLMQFSRYARAEGGMGSLFISSKTYTRTFIGAALGMAIVIAILSYKGLLLLIPCFIAGFGVRSHAYSKIGGMTGDIFGAANEVCEIVFMLCAIIIERL